MVHLFSFLFIFILFLFFITLLIFQYSVLDVRYLFPIGSSGSCRFLKAQKVDFYPLQAMKHCLFILLLSNIPKISPS